MVSTTDEVVAPTDVPMADIKAINEEDFLNAQKVFQTGKKNLFLNKYDESVNNIGDACKIYSAKFGEMDSQCAEIYYFYGRALLELARVENTVLGNALNGVPEDTSPIDDSRYGNPDDIAEEEQKDITEKVIDALCEERKPEESTEAKPAEGETKVEGAEAKSEEKTTEAKAEVTEAKAEVTETKAEEKTAEEKTTEEKTTEEKTTEEKTAEATETKAEVTETKAEVTETKAEEKTAEATETKAEVTKEKTATEMETKTEEKTETKVTETPAEGETKTEEGKGEAAEEEGEEEGEEEEDAEDDEDLTKNDEQVKDEAEAEEISNLQRAWEMFELAKLVYSKNFDNDLTFKNKRIAECLLKLGEISIEQEVYEQAIIDITESIRIQEEQKEDRDERMLAESFYQLGLCQQFANLFKDANDTYQKSINIMQLRIEKLKGKMELIKEDKDSEAERNTMKDEITELEALLPEMMSKLEEVNEQGEKSISLIKEAKEMMMNTMTTEAKGGETKPCGEVKDITNMVKSKRKIDAVEETTSVKKTRLSEASETVTENSEPVANGEKMETETKPEEKAAKTEEAMPKEVEAPAPITA